MPRLSFQDPTNTRNLYLTTDPNDPNVPAGYILQDGYDGAADRDVQFFVPGQCSGGFPRYPVGTGNDIATDLRLLDGTGSTGV